MPARGRSAERARARRRARARVPSRAVRRARSPREPSGPILRLRLAAEAWAAAWGAAVKAIIIPELERFGRAPSERSDAADGGGPPAQAKAAKALVAKARARVTRSPGAFGAASQTTAGRVVAHSKNEFGRLGIKLREAEPKLDKLITGWRAENVDKITTLGEAELDTVEGILAAGEGRTVDSLAKQLLERIDVTASKARQLATDQVLTLNAQITRERQQAAGIESYIWTTVGDERVREMHEDLDGEEFSWDDPPITNQQGDRNHPGEDYSCRCTPFPVLPELAADEDQQAEAAE